MCTAWLRNASAEKEKGAAGRRSAAPKTLWRLTLVQPLENVETESSIGKRREGKSPDNGRFMP
jgi:hypothetical protein